MSETKIFQAAPVEAAFEIFILKMKLREYEERSDSLRAIRAFLKTIEAMQFSERHNAPHTKFWDKLKDILEYHAEHVVKVAILNELDSFGHIPSTVTIQKWAAGENVPSPDVLQFMLSKFIAQTDMHINRLVEEIQGAKARLDKARQGELADA